MWPTMHAPRWYCKWHSQAAGSKDLQHDFPFLDAGRRDEASTATRNLQHPNRTHHERLVIALSHYRHTPVSAFLRGPRSGIVRDISGRGLFYATIGIKYTACLLSQGSWLSSSDEQDILTVKPFSTTPFGLHTVFWARGALVLGGSRTCFVD